MLSRPLAKFMTNSTSELTSVRMEADTVRTHEKTRVAYFKGVVTQGRTSATFVH